MEHKVMFVEQLAEKARNKLFSMKNEVITKTVEETKRLAERTSEQGYFTCQYSTDTLSPALISHHQSMVNCIRNRLQELGFSDPKVRLENVTAPIQNSFREQIIGYKITTTCTWYPQISDQ